MEHADATARTDQQADHDAAAAIVRELQRVLQYVPADEVERLLQLVAQAEIDIVAEPACGFVMLSLVDCFQTDFHLGEVLVTTAEVRLGDVPGHATVMGDEPRRAVAMASVDAVLHGPADPLQAAVREFVRQAVATVEAQWEAESRAAAATRVEFESMVEG